MSSQQTLNWEDAAIPWRNIDCTTSDAFFIGDSNRSQSRELRRMNNILDAKYQKADLRSSVNDMEHLASDEQQQLLELLQKYEGLFDGTLGKWTGTPYKIKTKEAVEPHHAKPYPVPHIRELTLKAELDRLVKVGILNKVNRSEWAAPTFIIPKKDGTVKFISDFRELNKRIRRTPYPILKI